MQNKVLLVLVTILISSCASLAQVTKDETTLKSVYDIKDQSKDQIYKKSMAWVAKTFMSAKAVTSFGDADIGMITLNGVFFGNYYLTYFYDAEYKMTIEVKDGRIRVTQLMGDVIVNSTNRYPMTWRYRDEYLLVRAKLEGLSASLVSSLSDPETEDW